MFPGFTPGECNGLNTASSETFLFFQGLQFTLDRQLKGWGGGRLLQLNCGRMEVTTTMQLGTFGFIAGLWGKSLCLNSFLLQ